MLKDAVKKQVKAQAVQFEKRLQSVIREKVGEFMADLETTIGGLGSIDSELMARSHFGDELWFGWNKTTFIGVQFREAKNYAQRNYRYLPLFPINFYTGQSFILQPRRSLNS